MMTASRFIKCVDNILQRETLTVGRIYEQIGIARDGYVTLSGLGQFSASRFEASTYEEWAAQGVVAA